MISALRRIHPVDWIRMFRTGDHRLKDPSLVRFLPSLAKKSGGRSPPPEMKRGRPFHPRAILLIVGILFLVLGGYPFQLALQSKQWSQVEGNITRSTLSHAFPFHRTDMEYTYLFNNNRHQNNRIGFGLGDRFFLLEGFAKRIVERYPTGKQVKIFVNPKNPAESVLEATPSMGGGFFLMVSGLFCFYVRAIMLPEK
ncbi:MAG: DUF3592 domain-containing protein [Magnetococcales bacterium]|nr:DUF3592 domain-containing protein [Magnetococcales bacterium]